MDAIVGRTLQRLGADDLLVIMSDHGFVSWRRAFNLNTWLRDNGYLTLRQGRRPGGAASFEDIDWTGTRAYGLGLNGLYINLRGRESSGIVDPGARDALVREIGDKLLRTIDPAHRNTGGHAGSSAASRSTGWPGTRTSHPTSIVGYARGTRASDESALGGVPPEVIVDNRSAWSGDHCMDPDAVPGILLTSRRLRRPAATPAATLRRPSWPSSASTDFPRRARSTDMFGSSIKLDKALLAKVKRYADLAGYSSVEEFITHALEKEIAHLETADTEDEIKKRLKGLGYIS